MMKTNAHTTPKAPRWITTAAGQWAWATNEEWRRFADRALSVSERQRLLAEAERLHSLHVTPAEHA
ncbi:MAG: hypothetical protein K6356_05075 [Chloroflexus sp.]